MARGAGAGRFRGGARARGAAGRRLRGPASDRQRGSHGSGPGRRWRCSIGGRSTEREVSLRTGAALRRRAPREGGYDVDADRRRRRARGPARAARASTWPSSRCTAAGARTAAIQGLLESWSSPTPARASRVGDRHGQDLLEAPLPWARPRRDPSTGSSRPSAPRRSRSADLPFGAPGGGEARRRGLLGRRAHRAGPGAARRRLPRRGAATRASSSWSAT